MSVASREGSTLLGGLWAYGTCQGRVDGDGHAVFAPAVSRAML